LASFFGFRSRTLIFVLVSFLCDIFSLLSLVSFSYVEVFENCSGEEQPSFIPAQVWGVVLLSANRITKLWLLFVWVVCRCVVFGDTEGHLLPALNVLFGNQVVEMNQFTSWALAPFISWFCGGRVPFFLRCIHLGSLMLSASVPSVRGHSEKQRSPLRLAFNERSLWSELFL